MSPHRRVAKSLSLLLLLFLPTIELRADLATITVDLARRTVSPPNPTVNIAANDSIILNILNNGAVIHGRVKTSLAGPRPIQKLNAHGVYEYAEHHLVAEGTSPLMVFRGCDAQARREFRIAARPGSPDSTVDPDCPFYTLEQSQRAWTIVEPEGIVLVQIESDVPKEEFAFAIQVVQREYALSWSGGFALLGLRDEQFSLQPIAGDDQHLRLVPAGEGEVPYQLAAFAHYVRLDRRFASFAVSFGLATKVPVNALTVMAGLTATFRTLPIINAGHLTAGVAYGPRLELRPEYRGISSVPVGISTASLTSQRYNFGLFAALTFSFFGGEEQFKGVYSGKASHAEPPPKDQ